LQEDIARFQVAVDDFLDVVGMQEMDSPGHLGEQAYSRLLVRLKSSQMFAKVAAADVFHREIRLAVVLAGVVNADNALVLELSGRADFHLKALDDLRSGR